MMKIFYDNAGGSSVTDAFEGMWQVSNRSKCGKCGSPKVSRWMWRSIRLQKRYAAIWIGPMTKREVGRAIRDWAAKMERPAGCIMVQWFAGSTRFIQEPGDGKKFSISIYWSPMKTLPDWDRSRAGGLDKPKGFPARV